MITTTFVRDIGRKGTGRQFGPRPSDVGAQAGDDLLECLACGKPFAEGDFTTLVSLGPGADTESRERARAGNRYYNAVCVEVCWDCATGGTPPVDPDSMIRPDHLHDALNALLEKDRGAAVTMLAVELVRWIAEGRVRHAERCCQILAPHLREGVR